MIGKAKSVRGSVAGMDYLREEGKGYELDRNRLIGDTSAEIMQEFRIQQLNNTTCDKNMITAVLSPDIKDGEKLTDAQLKEIGRDFMKGIGVDTEKQAYIMIVHTEKSHKHIHFYANRIQENGKAIEDKFIGKKAQVVAHNIAKERGLVSARDLMFEKKSLSMENEKQHKNEIFKKHQSVMRTNPKTFKGYMQAMNLKGLEVQPTINKQGQVQGFRVKDKANDKNYKMSEVNRSMSISNLIKSGLKNDLDSGLTGTLKNVDKMQDIALEASRLVKYKTPTTSKEKGFKFNLGKQKMTMKEHLAFEKLADEVMIPNAIKEQAEQWEKGLKDKEEEQKINKNKEEER
jgi:hypothetical protein